MATKVLKGVIGRGLREAGASLKERSEIMEVRHYNYWYNDCYLYDYWIQLIQLIHC